MDRPLRIPYVGITVDYPFYNNNNNSLHGVLGVDMRFDGLTSRF